jgi:hypothetical protein
MCEPNPVSGQNDRMNTKLLPKLHAHIFAVGVRSQTENYESQASMHKKPEIKCCLETIHTYLGIYVCVCVCVHAYTFTCIQISPAGHTGGLITSMKSPEGYVQLSWTPFAVFKSKSTPDVPTKSVTSRTYTCIIVHLQHTSSANMTFDHMHKILHRRA